MWWGSALMSAQRNDLGMLRWHNSSSEGRGFPPSWLDICALSCVVVNTHPRHCASWIISLDREKNRQAGRALIRVQVKSAHGEMEWVPELEAWEGVGLWLLAEQGGVGVGERKWDLAFWQQLAVRCYQLDVKQQPEPLLHHVSSGCQHLFSALAQLADLAESKSCHHIFPSMENSSLLQAGYTGSMRERWEPRQSSPPTPEPCGVGGCSVL